MGHPIHKHMSSRAFDAKQAYNKDLSDSARLHYLENDEHDKGMSRNAAGMVPGAGSAYDAQSGAIAKKRSTARSAAGMVPGAGSIPDAPNSRNSSPANNVSFGDKSGVTGYIGEQREDLMKYNPVDDRAGMSRHTAEHSTKEYMSRKDAAIQKSQDGMSRYSNYDESPASGIIDGAVRYAAGKAGQAVAKGAKKVIKGAGKAAKNVVKGAKKIAGSSVGKAAVAVGKAAVLGTGGGIAAAAGKAAGKAIKKAKIGSKIGTGLAKK